jgi:tripartite-type tricarboxylate transporter receptor subunit TctC
MNPLKTVPYLPLLVVAFISHDACAQTYPSQTVRIVVPFNAGSITDGFARVLSTKLKDIWHQDVIVENRPGYPGTASVARAAPDGYTLLVTSNGHTIANAVNKSPSFDPVKDFAGVTKIATVPQVLIVPITLPVTTVQQFIDLAKAKPGTLNFATAGIASQAYLAAQVFMTTAGISLNHVPYRGGAEATTATIRGDSDFTLTSVQVAKDFAETSKARIIAVGTPERLKELPDVPTIAELGLPAFKFESWFGLMVPAKTPAPIIAKINRDVMAVLEMADVRKVFNDYSTVPATSTPEEFDAVIAADTERNTKIVRDANPDSN